MEKIADLIDDAEIVVDTTPLPKTARVELRDEKQEAFAQLVATGMPKRRAWLTVFETKAKNKEEAGTQGQMRLMKKPLIRDRVKYLTDSYKTRQAVVQEEAPVSGDIDREFLLRKTFAKMTEHEMAFRHTDAYKHLELLAKMAGVIGGGANHLHLHGGRPDTRTGTEIMSGVLSELRSLFPAGSIGGGAIKPRDSGGAGDESPSGDAATQAEPDGSVSSVPKAAGVSQARVDDEETVPDGWESGGQDLQRGDGDVLPSDREIS